MEVKPLTPLANGIVLIVGGKASNFDEEIKTHPRVTIWDSQQQHWTSKDLPSNTKAIFMTRFLGHAQFGKIVAEARKKQITIFNPEGTGMIMRQVRELLSLNIPRPVVNAPMPIPTPPISQGEIMPHASGPKGKLKQLIPFINLAKNNLENAKILMVKAKELGVDTTEGSLAQLTSVERRKNKPKPVRVPLQELGLPKELDITVSMLDGVIKGLQDMRQFLIDTTTENRVLRAKVDRFKKALLEA